MSAALKKFYTHVAAQPCLKCGRYGCEVAHVRVMPSAKTTDFLPRRRGAAEFAAIPLCPLHHRTGENSIHALGEARFMQSLGKPECWVFGYVAKLIADALS